MYMHSDVASAGSDKIECLLIIRGLSDETILKELHKDIAKYTVSPKVLMEAITALDRSAQTLDHQLNGPEKSRRMNNGQGARCHTCQGTGHSKEQCTVSKDKLYCKNCKKRAYITPTIIVRDSSKKPKRTKMRKKTNDPTRQRERRRMLQRNPVTEIPPQ